MKKSISEKFLFHPDELYENPDTLDEASVRELMELEEMVVTFVHNEPSGKVSEEEGFALEMDRLLDKEDHGFSSEHCTALQQVLKAVELMDKQDLPTKKLPPVLRGIVDRDLENLSKEKRVPSIILQLAENGLNVIKSSLQGLVLLPEISPEMRSGAAVLE